MGCGRSLQEEHSGRTQEAAWVLLPACQEPPRHPLVATSCLQGQQNPTNTRDCDISSLRLRAPRLPRDMWSPNNRCPIPSPPPPRLACLSHCKLCLPSLFWPWSLRAGRTHQGLGCLETPKHQWSRARRGGADSWRGCLPLATSFDSHQNIRASGACPFSGPTLQGRAPHPLQPSPTPLACL